MCLGVVDSGHLCGGALRALLCDNHAVMKPSSSPIGAGIERYALVFSTASRIAELWRQDCCWKTGDQ